MVAVEVIVASFVLLIVVVLALIISGIKIIPPYERGICLLLGRYIRVLEPGFNFVTPLVSSVIRIDMRTQSIAVNCRNMRFRDGQKAELVTFIDYRVKDPAKLYSSLANVKFALADMTERTTRLVVGKTPLDEFDRRRDQLNERLTEAAKNESSTVGIEVIYAEVREAGTQPIPLDVPFNRRHTTPKGVLFFDTTDHEAPRKAKIPKSYGAARPMK